MEQWNEDQIWQRVQMPRTGLKELTAGALSQAAAFLTLSRAFQGQRQLLLRQLYGQERRHAACLRGIQVMLTGELPAVRAVMPEEKNPRLLLQKAYGDSLRTLRDYENRCGDREYGPVFQELAAEK